MKFAATFLSVLVVVNAVSDEEQWATFKTDFAKTYKSAREESLRFGIFQNNLREIEAHNVKYERGEESWAMGVNQFTDLTKEEVHNLYSMPEFQLPEDADIYDAEEGIEPDDTVDWREKGAVIDVLNQGMCGSCYAFSAMGCLEGQRAIRQKVLQQLSEQEVVDCAESYGPAGCGGGWMYQVYDYVKDHGISLESEYSYKAVRETCENSTVKRVDVKVTGTKFIRNNTVAFKHAVGHVGPIAISIYHGGFSGYSKGIFDNPQCPHYTTHAVLIVGYGSENGTDYWVIKNSWGKSWGENGYIRIKRYENSVCGMFDHGMYPQLE